MNVQDCYRILGVPPSSDMDRVKSAFRKQAFKLHPDLNPSPDAQERFQQLNEAYVLLKEALESGPSGESKQQRSKPTTSAQEGAKAYRQQQRTSASANPGAATSGQTGKAKGAQSRKTFFYSKEEVLGDILNDPFARQVYEDIYKQVRQGQSGRNTKRAVERSLKVNLGKKDMTFDLSRGPVTRAKDWLKGQLDDEQTVTFPAHQLIPGRTLRLEISTRFGKPKTIEIRIPADFKIGRPIRLRGLGRSLGPFKGDMFLNILGK